MDIFGRREQNKNVRPALAKRVDAPEKNSVGSYDDSGHCPLSKAHKFIPVFDEDQKVGIFCIYCDYVLYEHAGNVSISSAGELVGTTLLDGSLFILPALHD